MPLQVTKSDSQTGFLENGVKPGVLPFWEYPVRLNTFWHAAKIKRAADRPNIKKGLSASGKECSEGAPPPRGLLEIFSWILSF